MQERSAVRRRSERQAHGNLKVDHEDHGHKHEPSKNAILVPANRIAEGRKKAKHARDEQRIKVGRRKTGYGHKSTANLATSNLALSTGKSFKQYLVEDYGPFAVRV